MTESTLHHCNDYKGGKLSISWIIYGDPKIRWHLNEETPYGKRLIAESYDKKEIESLLAELSSPNKFTSQQHIKSL